MNEKNLSGAGRRWEKLLCGIASVLFPTSIFCYFCAQNINEFAALWLIFFMLGVLIILAAVVYCASLLILRRGFLALVFCVVCWIGCYLEPTVRRTLSNHGIMMANSRRLLYTALLILAAAALAVYMLHGIKRDMRKPVLLFSALFTLILTFNLLPIAKAGFSGGADTQRVEQIYQTEFYVDAAKSDVPNVYWIHPDGMTSVDVVEKYYHDEQSEFLSVLTARGFSISSSAHFEAGAKTIFAIPALTSPYAYDTWLSGYSATHEDAKRAVSSYAFQTKLRDVRYHNEMIAAFDKKGYASSVISFYDVGYYFPLSGGAFYDVENDRDEIDLADMINVEKRVRLNIIKSNMGKISSNMWKISEFLSWIFGHLYVTMFDTLPSRWSEELTVLPFTTKMPEEPLKQIIPGSYTYNGVFYRKMIRSLYDILYGKTQAPKLVIIHDLMPHGAFAMDENGALTDHVWSLDPMDYYPQHVFSAKVLADMIGMILEADPDAVIVVQADHGLHMNTEEDFKAAFGEDADAIELWNGTMSAIRVPEKYRTGEEHYAMENPLNLSRYLVNSFVGQNYEYLPPN